MLPQCVGAHTAAGARPAWGYRAMLTERYGGRVAALLVPVERFRPYPEAAERPSWEALPAELRQALILAADRHLGGTWPVLPATLFMEFQRNGNRSRYERESFARRAALSALVAGECAEGRGRFLDDIVNGIWAICEESFWGVPAHNDSAAPLPDVDRPVFDLFAGETGALLAWTRYLLRAGLDGISPRVSARIREEVDRRILTPFLDRDDFWWMGLRGDRAVNNWNPWCMSNALAAALVLEDDGDRRVAMVEKALRCLDRFIDPHPADGGCDEGTSYWDRAGGSLFDCLELLHQGSGGAIDLYGEPLIREIGRFLYREHIAGPWFVNFADGGARVHISADLVHRYGGRIGDPALAALGAAAHRGRRRAGAAPAGPLPRLLAALFHFNDLEAEAETAQPPLLRDVWLPAIQVMAAREHPGSSDGLYVAAKGGHNAESHNHNDVGQFILYWNGEPAVIDAGVGTYTAQTFGKGRYDIWTMQSQYHNLPTVRGVGQRAGRAFHASGVAYRVDGESSALSLDIAGAYPPEAGIAAWQRTVCLVRGGAPARPGGGGRVEVVEAFRLTTPTDDVRLTLLTRAEPAPIGADGVELARHAGARLLLWFDRALVAGAEPVAVDDGRLRGVWGERVWRLTLRPRAPVTQGEWHLTFCAETL